MNGLKANYWALSGWIANLGVVPWLLFLAFLLAPCLVFFALRIFRVTRVRETMVSLLNNLSGKTSPFLPILAIFVKILLLCGALEGQAQTKPLKSHQKTLILSKGEQRELSFPLLSRFSVGNRQVVSTKWMKTSKKLLVKGKMLGYSDIVVWSKRRQEQLHVYVLSKKKYLETMHLAQAMQDMGLSVAMKGPYLQVEGELGELSDYQTLLPFLTRLPHHAHLPIQLSLPLRKAILSQIYPELFKARVQNFHCEFENLYLVCRFNKTTPPSEELKTELARHFLIRWIPEGFENHHDNFRIKLKLIQLEQQTGEELKFGLEHLEGELRDIFTYGVANLFKRNLFFLQNHSLNLSVLAEPEVLVQLGKPAKLSLGADIPYQTESQNGPNTQWAFAGLKLELRLEPQGKGYRLSYTSELTAPKGSQIAGSKVSSVLYANIQEPLHGFQLALKTIGKQEFRFPLLSSLPLLGKLFVSSTDTENYKKIHGILTIEPEQLP